MSRAAINQAYRNLPPESEVEPRPDLIGTNRLRIVRPSKRRRRRSVRLYITLCVYLRSFSFPSLCRVRREPIPLQHAACACDTMDALVSVRLRAGRAGRQQRDSSAHRRHHDGSCEERCYASACNHRLLRIEHPKMDGLSPGEARRRLAHHFARRDFALPGADATVWDILKATSEI